MGTYTGTPKTWATNDDLSAAVLNAEVRDLFTALGGAWTAYTPTLGNWTLGNGAMTGRYMQFGKLVIFQATLTFGSTTAVVAGAPYLTLPVAAYAAHTAILTGLFRDYGTNTYEAAPVHVSVSQAWLYLKGTTNGVLNTGPNGTTPFTWGASDEVRVSGIYEAA